MLDKIFIISMAFILLTILFFLIGMVTQNVVFANLTFISIGIALNLIGISLFLMGIGIV